MGDRIAKYLVVIGLIAVVAVPIGVRAFIVDDAAASAGGDSSDRLIVITPHNEQIRYEMAQGFNRWRVSQGLGPVTFDWRASGGTSDLRKGILSQFKAKADAGKGDEGIGADLFFGGGAYDHDKIASGVDLDNDPKNDNNVIIAVEPRLPAGLLESAIPDAEAFGRGKLEKLYHVSEQGEVLWIGTVLSSFGIVYNVDALERLGIDPPTTWEDLADPRLANWVALANPSHSSSAAAAYHVILQRRGWTEGWAVLRGAFANSRYFTNSSSKVPVDVTTRDAAAGMAIDFYGRFQAGSVPAAPDRVKYVDPSKTLHGETVSLTATTADPITLLRGAPNRAVAEQFIAWLLMPETQRLWQLKVGQPGGPERFELRRQPIAPNAYQDKAGWTDPEIDPYATAAPLAPGTPDVFRIIAPLTSAMAIDIHDEMSAAWKALNLAQASGHPRLSEMREAFYALPEVLTLELPEGWRAAQADPEHPDHEAVLAALKTFETRLKGLDTSALHREWRSFFQQQYAKVIELGGS